MNVTWWLDEEFTRWNGALDSNPEINGTGVSMAHMQALIVGRYNEVHGATATAADFTWNETAPPVPEALTVDPE